MNDSRAMTAAASHQQQTSQPRDASLNSGRAGGGRAGRARQASESSEVSSVPGSYVMAGSITNYDEIHDVYVC